MAIWHDMAGCKKLNISCMDFYIFFSNSNRTLFVIVSSSTSSKLFVNELFLISNVVMLITLIVFLIVSHFFLHWRCADDWYRAP
jgi:hypothetical protein